MRGPFGQRKDVDAVCSISLDEAHFDEDLSIGEDCGTLPTQLGGALGRHAPS